MSCPKVIHKSNNDEVMTTSSKQDDRKETRYSCVGIPLVYSAANDSPLNGLGQKFYHAATVDMSMTGLAFDLEQPLLYGDKIIVLLDKSEGFIQEELVTEVRWCKKLSSDQYRVGVVVDVQQKPILEHAIPEINFNNARMTPTELKIDCPACKKHSDFTFVAYQPILGGKGVMPLYDCSSCGTTRSLPGIFKN